MLPELPTFAQFFLKEDDDDEGKLALEAEDSEEQWEEERTEAFFLFFPVLKLALLLFMLAPVLPPLVEFGRAAVDEPEEISLDLKDEEDDLVVALLPDERDFSARPEAREGAEEDKDEDKWAEGICGNEDTCLACVVPKAGCSWPP